MATRRDGTITERTTGHWRLGYDGTPGPDGRRKQVRVSFKGSKKEASAELRRLLGARDAGAADPSSVTVGEYLGAWLGEPEGLSPKTIERYKGLARLQIVPYLGAAKLQQLRPAQIADWLQHLSKTGISPRTIGHARRLLHTAYARALRREEVSRNPVAATKAPKVETAEIAIVADVPALLRRIASPTLRRIAAVALATGMRRGELCALAWNAVDLDRATVRVERSVEQTKAGLRFKEPKSRAGQRTISIPASTVEMLRQHRAGQAERYLKAALRPVSDLVFARPDGMPRAPDGLSNDWRDAKLGVSFHSLRHTHASALIAAGLDVLSISRRLGHADASVTLRVYAHLFDRAKSDDRARDAIGAILG
jgi:integrase